MKFMVSRFSFNFKSRAYDLHDLKYTNLLEIEVRVESKLKVILHVLRRKTSYFLKFLLFNEGFGFSIELTIDCFVNCQSLKTIGNYLVAMPIIITS